MFKRIVSGFLGIPFLIYILLKGEIYLYIIATLVALIGLYEFYYAMKHKGYKPITFIGYLLTIIILSFFYFSFNMTFLFAIIISSIFIVSILQLYNSTYNIIDNSITFYGIIYVTILIGHIILTDKLPNNKIIWLIFIIAWSTDTFAYFGGYFFGKRKLCPKISPKKTIEGGICGIIGSIFSCGIFAYVFFIEYIIMFILLGIIGSVFSQIGDLTASQIKRYVGIKDFGNLIPGHGGILDRFDSILFTAPIVYYFFIIFIK